MTSAVDFAAALRSAQAADPTSIMEVVMQSAEEVGASDVVAYLVDFEQNVLEPLPDRSTHAEVSHPEEVATTIAGRAFLDRKPVTAPREDGTRVWVPIAEGSDATGVLAMTVKDASEDQLRDCGDLGVLAGYLIAAHARTTDLYHLHRRRKAMSLAANMQWDLLPPLSVATSRVAIAGRLEPAYEVGGDCFDYALNGPILDVALLDAMGHGVRSACIAGLAIGAYRHGRREGRSLEHIHRRVGAVLEEQLDGYSFATGQLARLELDTGSLSWTNAGHPGPLLIRGGRVVSHLACSPTLPWGLGGDSAEVSVEPLEPGDSVLFYTDGVVEARSPGGEDYGIERLTDLVGRCASDQLPPEAVVRQLVKAVLEHHNERLRDDATVLLVEWYGPGA